MNQKKGRDNILTPQIKDFFLKKRNIVIKINFLKIKKYIYR